MKKFLVAMAAILAMTVSINAKDKKQACTEGAQCDKQEQCDKQKGECPAFEGLNLTDDQKQQLQELRKNCADSKKDAKQQKKEARQECKKETLGKIKAILTPEQYVQFLENSFLNGGGQQCKGVKPGQRPGKSGKQGPRGERHPQRDAQDAPQQQS